jgi:hypothetical protein
MNFSYMFAELSQKKRNTICIPQDWKKVHLRVLEQFIFKKSPVDWNGRYETPAESECLRGN